jgi:putative transposase
MARKLRVQYPGAIYHVMSRGNQRRPIARDDADRLLLLKTLAEACGKTGWQIHAYCIMNNHFHLVVETPQANLVAGMKWLLGTYTGRFNRRHKLFGHLFSGRYKSLIVDGSGTGYLRTVCDYVHLNPVRAKLLPRDKALKDYGWSSYNDYLRASSKRPSWLRVDRVFGEMGIPQDSAAGRREFQKRMELRRLEGRSEDWNKVRRGWCMGDNIFRKELLAMMAGRMGAEHYGEERRETDEARAERLVSEELKKARWNEQTLEQRRKGDPAKIRMAQRLRRETTMTHAWIAQRLKMGTRGHLTHLLYWQGRK